MLRSERSFHRSLATLAVVITALLVGQPVQANPKSAAKAQVARATKGNLPLLVGPRSNPRAALVKSLRAKQGGKKGTPSQLRADHVENALVIGVMGGAGANTPPKVGAAVSKLGAAIADNAAILLTGACTGLPDIATIAAKARGGVTMGISPYRTLAKHKDAGSPTNFDVLKLTYHPALVGQNRPNYMGREIDNIEHSDAIVILGGRFGTLGEFAIAADERRPIGILSGSGGIADVIKTIVAASTAAGKPPGAPVIYDSNPQRLVSRLIKATREFQKTGSKGPLGDHYKAQAKSKNAAK